MSLDDCKNPSVNVFVRITISRRSSFFRSNYLAIQFDGGHHLSFATEPLNLRMHLSRVFSAVENAGRKIRWARNGGVRCEFAGQDN